MFLGFICILLLCGAAVAGDFEIKDVKYKPLYRDSLGYVWFGLQVEVENTGASRNIYVEIKALDGDGYPIKDFILSGYIEAGRRATLTKKSFMRPDEFGKIRKWACDDTGYKSDYSIPYSF